MSIQIQQLSIHLKTIPACANVQVLVNDKVFGFFVPDQKPVYSSNQSEWWLRDQKCTDVTKDSYSFISNDKNAILEELTYRFHDKVEEPKSAAEDLYTICVDYAYKRLLSFRLINERQCHSLSENFLTQLAEHYQKSYDDLHQFIVEKALHPLVFDCDIERAQSKGEALPKLNDLLSVKIQIAEHAGISFSDLLAFLEK